MVRGLFDDLPRAAPAQEEAEAVLAVGATRIERIVSFGHSTDWFDQDEDEWVTVLTGEAVLEFADGSVRTLRPGDHEYLPRHRRHRVASTAPNEPTVWLAVFMQ